MKKQKVLVCDDNFSAAANWANRLSNIPSISKFASVDSASKKVLTEIIEGLRVRQTEVRKGSKYKVTCEIDQYDILIVDYDLIEIDEIGRVTGEFLAGLTRLFSKCGFVVVLNQQSPELDFDLTMRRDFESRADLGVPAAHIFNSGLWGKERIEFRPWHWPYLLNAAKKQRARERELKGNLDKQVAKFLQFPDDVIDKLPRTASEHLGVKREPASITFRDFVRTGSLGVDPKDRESILENAEICTRIAAARVSRWLENSLLAPQDILIDVPHLAHQMPFLLDGDIKKLSTWNKTTDIEGVTGIRTANLAAHKFKAENWLSRPAYWWATIQDDKRLLKNRRDFDIGTVPEFVFREDTGDFGLRSDSEEFVPEMTSAFDRRFIAKLTGTKYGPFVRLAM